MRNLLIFTVISLTLFSSLQAQPVKQIKKTTEALASLQQHLRTLPDQVLLAKGFNSSEIKHIRNWITDNIPLPTPLEEKLFPLFPVPTSDVSLPLSQMQAPTGLSTIPGHIISTVNANGNLIPHPISNIYTEAEYTQITATMNLFNTIFLKSYMDKKYALSRLSKSKTPDRKPRLQEEAQQAKDYYDLVHKNYRALISAFKKGVPLDQIKNSSCYQGLKEIADKPTPQVPYKLPWVNIKYAKEDIKEILIWSAEDAPQIDSMMKWLNTTLLNANTRRDNAEQRYRRNNSDDLLQEWNAEKDRYNQIKADYDEIVRTLLANLKEHLPLENLARLASYQRMQHLAKQIQGEKILFRTVDSNGNPSQCMVGYYSAEEAANIQQELDRLNRAYQKIRTDAQNAYHNYTKAEEALKKRQQQPLLKDNNPRSSSKDPVKRLSNAMQKREETRLLAQQMYHEYKKIIRELKKGTPWEEIKNSASFKQVNPWVERYTAEIPYTLNVVSSVQTKDSPGFMKGIFMYVRSASHADELDNLMNGINPVILKFTQDKRNANKRYRDKPTEENGQEKEKCYQRYNEAKVCYDAVVAAAKSGKPVDEIKQTDDYIKLQKWAEAPRPQIDYNLPIFRPEFRDIRLQPIQIYHSHDAQLLDQIMYTINPIIQNLWTEKLLSVSRVRSNPSTSNKVNKQAQSVRYIAYKADYDDIIKAIHNAIAENTPIRQILNLPSYQRFLEIANRPTPQLSHTIQVLDIYHYGALKDKTIAVWDEQEATVVSRIMNTINPVIQQMLKDKHRLYQVVWKDPYSLIGQEKYRQADKRYKGTKYYYDAVMDEIVSAIQMHTPVTNIENSAFYQALAAPYYVEIYLPADGIGRIPVQSQEYAEQVSTLMHPINAFYERLQHRLDKVAKLKVNDRISASERNLAEVEYSIAQRLFQSATADYELLCEAIKTQTSIGKIQRLPAYLRLKKLSK